MQLMLTCKHSVGLVMKSITNESINSGQGNISPLSTNAYSCLPATYKKPFIDSAYCFETILLIISPIVLSGKSNPLFLIYRFKGMNLLSYAGGTCISV